MLQLKHMCYKGKDDFRKKLGIIAILRAGLGVVDGILKTDTCSELAIGLYRDPGTYAD